MTDVPWLCDIQVTGLFVSCFRPLIMRATSSDDLVDCFRPLRSADKKKCFGIVGTMIVRADEQRKKKQHLFTNSS
jgi:hypothetical protein